jgi:hypothetical protein
MPVNPKKCLEKQKELSKRTNYDKLLSQPDGPMKNTDSFYNSFDPPGSPSLRHSSYESLHSGNVETPAKRETLVDKCKAGDYVLAPKFEMAFKVVSGKHLADYGIIVADEKACAMECYWTNPVLKQTEFSKGQITVDYFKNKFLGPYNKKEMDTLLEKIEKEFKEQLTVRLGKKIKKSL